MKLFIFSLIVLSFYSCKTQEQIRREQMVDNMAIQIEEQQKLVAESTIKMQSIEEKMAAMTGKMDEVQYNNQQTYGQKISEINSRVKLLEESNEVLLKDVQAINKTLEEQQAYLKKVISTLESVSGKSSKPKGSLYSRAMANYKKGKYKTAKGQLLELLNGNKVKGSQKARVLHNLGMISYMDKKFDTALTYFSKLFTEYPKSGYNKNGLLFLAKSFKASNQNEQAKQTLNELISRFPKAKQVKEANKILKSL